METIFTFACAHANSAYWIIFLMLMLAGLNFPFSEDILLIAGGAIASVCIPEQTWHLYGWIYAGCWISAWEAYAIGRFLGPRVYEWKYFNRVINPQRIENLHYYYEKFGVLTFLVVRFIPGGFRNALYMTSGLGKMPFWKFTLRDGFALIFSSLTLFFIGYSVGENYHSIVHYVETYNGIALVIFIVTLICIAVYFWRKP